jgi:putative ABC transport system substrate-binding protein
MNRRAFVSLLSGAAGWPLAARAQRTAMPVVGFLSSRSQHESAQHVLAFQQGLNALGYVDCRNVAIEYRWADGHYERLQIFASELVARPATVIVATGGNVSATAAKAATTTIPIVFIAGDDPVKLGLVASLNRPSGNATGMSVFTSELAAKRLELLHELAPKATVVSVLVNPNYPGSTPEITAVQTAALGIGLRIRVLNASSERDIEAASETFGEQPVGALLVGADALFVSRREQLVALARRHSVPSIYDLREYPEVAGLMSYGTNLTDVYRQIGVYTGRVLRRETRRPAGATADSF